MSAQPLPGAAFLSALWQRWLQHEPHQTPVWSRYAVAVLLTLGAAWLRIQLAPAESGGRFITFSMAATLAALYGGFRAGMLSVVLGMVVLNFFLVRPYFSMAIANPMEAFWLNLWHFLTQLLVVGAIALMQRRARQLQAYANQLKTTGEQLDDTFEHTASGMAHNRVNGSWLRVNQTYCELIGYTREEIWQLTFRDFTHPEDVDLDETLLRRTLAGEITHYHLDKRYIHKDGHTVWVHLNLNLIRKADGSPHYLIAVVQDISVRKAAEEALRTNERLMRQAQALAGFASWECDIATGRFSVMGDAYKKLGLPGPEWNGEQLKALIHPDDRQRVQDEWLQAVRGVRPYNTVYRSPQDGLVRWFNVRAEMERDDTGRAIRAFGVTQDISTRKHTEQEIQKLNASLEQRIQDRTHALKAAYMELESYSYTVAHDLRSPLRLINGFAQALQEDLPELQAHNRQHLDRIKDASKKMGLLIDGLLKLSQYARGEIQRQPFNLSQLATRLLEELANQDPARRVTWEVQPDIHVLADRPLIDALLQNLLHNAWKYTLHTEAAHIRVYTREQADQTHYCVSDNGVGFDMAHAEKLFQPFQRMHMPHEFGGLGIGLATSRRIVQRHGGDLAASTSPGLGATFSFTLSAHHDAPTSIH